LPPVGVAAIERAVGAAAHPGWGATWGSMGTLRPLFEAIRDITGYPGRLERPAARRIGPPSPRAAGRFVPPAVAGSGIGTPVRAAGPVGYFVTARIASTSSCWPTTASNDEVITPSAPTTKSHGSVGIP